AVRECFLGQGGKLRLGEFRLDGVHHFLGELLRLYLLFLLILGQGELPEEKQRENETPTDTAKRAIHATLLIRSDHGGGDLTVKSSPSGWRRRYPYSRSVAFTGDVPRAGRFHTGFWFLFKPGEKKERPQPARSQLRSFRVLSVGYFAT